MELSFRNAAFSFELKALYIIVSINSWMKVVYQNHRHRLFLMCMHHINDQKKYFSIPAADIYVWYWVRKTQFFFEVCLSNAYMHIYFSNVVFRQL